MGLVLGNFIGKLFNLAIAAAVAWAAWYGYTHWIASPIDPTARVQTTAYNCRQAVARLAEETACRSSSSCTMTSDEVAAMQQRELDIEQHCN